MKHLVRVVCLHIFLMSFVYAQDASRWSVDFKGGFLYPDLPGWEQNYGKDRTNQFNISGAYKFLPWLELGMGGGYVSDRGQGFVYESFPLSLFATLRLRFTDGQWLVPYVGAGIDRLSYRVSVINDKQSKGAVQGSHVRAGLQLLLDKIDRQAFWSLSSDMGVEHIYFVMEAEQREAQEDTSGTDLGGSSYLVGFLVEF